MRFCIVRGCTTRDGKLNEKTLFRMPSEGTSECRVWLKSIGISKSDFELVKPHKRYVCADHFETRSFEVNFENELLHSTFFKRRKPKILIPNAVPSLKVNRDKPLSKRAKREQIRARKQLIDELLNASVKEGCDAPSVEPRANDVVSDKTASKDPCVEETKLHSSHRRLQENAQTLKNYGTSNVQFNMVYHVTDLYREQTSVFNDGIAVRKHALLQDAATQTAWSWSPDVQVVIKFTKSSQTETNPYDGKSSKHARIAIISKEAEFDSKLPAVIQSGPFDISSELVISKVKSLHPHTIHAYNGVISSQDASKHPPEDENKPLHESSPNRDVNHERPWKICQKTKNIDQILYVCQNERAAVSSLVSLDYADATSECERLASAMDVEYVECTPECIMPPLDIKAVSDIAEAECGSPFSSDAGGNDNYKTSADRNRTYLSHIQIKYDATDGTFRHRKPS